VFSFNRRKQSLEFQRLLGRLRDATLPNHLSQGEPQRRDDRFNRAIPTLLCPWEHDAPVVAEATFGLTRDIADHGVGLVMHQPLRVAHVVLGYWTDTDDASQPWFFVGESRRNVAIGGGFWTLGIELLEYANGRYAAQLQELLPMARKLLPAVEVPVTI